MDSFFPYEEKVFGKKLNHYFLLLAIEIMNIFFIWGREGNVLRLEERRWSYTKLFLLLLLLSAETLDKIVLVKMIFFVVVLL